MGNYKQEYLLDKILKANIPIARLIPLGNDGLDCLIVGDAHQVEDILQLCHAQHSIPVPVHAGENSLERENILLTLFLIRLYLKFSHFLFTQFLLIGCHYKALHNVIPTVTVWWKLNCFINCSACAVSDKGSAL